MTAADRKRTEGSYFPTRGFLGDPAYAGLVLGQPDNVLVARCPHAHNSREAARTCAEDIAHVATLPGELQVEWLDRKGQPTALPGAALHVSPERLSEMRATAAAAGDRRRAALLRALDDVAAYLGLV